MRFRTLDLKAKRVLYVVGAPTALHLTMLFTAARLAGWLAPDVEFTHVSFGQVLGEDRKLLRTRAGGAVKLRALLDEAVSRARNALETKLADEPPDDRATYSEAERQEIAGRVGLGAVKYFDLARERNSDYVFNWDNMLALQGNTAPYLLFAYTRIRSIGRKAVDTFGERDLYAANVSLILTHPAERTLALRLARFSDALETVAADLTPHVLCGYLYELSGEVMRFCEACPVIQAPDEATRLSRLRLCDLTARTLKLGLGLLGIQTVERM